MTTTPVDRPLPPGRGRHLFAAIGFGLRALKALPAPIRDRLFDSAVGGVSSSLPPFPDVVRLIEAAGGLPSSRRWQKRLLENRPELRAVRTRDISDDREGRLRARLYLPPANTPDPRAALVWVHGGAFVMGSLDGEEAHWPALELAAAGVPVLSVDYRLCLDGVHYPEPLDDVLTAWRWAVANADQLGVEASELHLGGGSAGGCLAAGAALRLRDNEQPVPASLFLGYPVLQPVMPPATPQMAAALADRQLVGDEWVQDMVATWAGTAPQDDPYVSPGLAGLAGLPPTYVLTCGADTLRRASEPFADRLRAAGVSVRHDVLTGAEHAPLSRPGTPDGEQAVQRMLTWITGGVAAMGV